MISGHTDLDPVVFQARYHAPLNSALARGDSFILGDAAGTDTLALEYLLSPSILGLYPDVRSRITVYASRRANAAVLQARGVRVVELDDNDHDNAAHPAQTPQSHSTAASRGGRAQQRQQGSSKGQFSTAVVGRYGRDARRYRHVQRDAAMTAASDYDILYVRTEAESRAIYGARYRPRVSATEMNRRAAKRTEGAGGKGRT